MNLQEQITRIKSMMGLLIEDESNDISTIILIGPQGVGKSTLSNQLSQKLNLPVVSSDEFIDQGDWALESNWSKGWQIRKENEFVGMVEYLQENLGKAVILDVGGSHGVWEGKHLQEIMSMVSSYPNRFLIIPTDNEKENQKFLTDRLKNRDLDMLTFGIKYWKAIIDGDEDFHKDEFSPEDRDDFLKKIELAKTDEMEMKKFKDYYEGNKKRHEGLTKNPELLTFTNDPDQKFDFNKNNSIEDYSQYFIKNMKESGLANHVIYNKGKETEALVDEIILKLK